jgi:ABC-type antimicrobial peptide transport system permease subunit
VVPADLSSTFWQYDYGVVELSLEKPGNHSPWYWAGAVFADPGQLGNLSEMFGSVSTVNWEFPLPLANVNADEAQALYNRLNLVSSSNGALSGGLQYASDDITISTPLLFPLKVFLQTQTSVMAVLLLLFVSLTAVGAAVLVLAAQMIADRRAAELAMRRARGASVRQVALLLAGAAIPAAVIGALAFGVLNLILGLALGAADRNLTLARLAVMGDPHRSKLAMTEALPAVLAATAAGLACALILPALMGTALDLSVFTGSSATVTLRPDIVSIGLPIAAMLILAAGTLVIQTRLAHRRDPGGRLLAG